MNVESLSYLRILNFLFKDRLNKFAFNQPPCPPDLSCKVHLDVRSLRIIHVDGSADRELLLPTFRLSLPGSFEPLCGLYLHLINPCGFIAF
jgi:hypothetical protein